MRTPPSSKSLPGFGDMARGALGTGGMGAGLMVPIVSGAVIARYGLGRTLRPIAALQSAAILLYVGLALTRPSVAAVSGVAVVEQLASAVGDSALVVFLMRRCAPEHKAAHFAIGSALMSIAATAAGPLSGYLAQRAGFPVLFLIAFAVSLPGVALAWAVPHE